jgi:hypothetical protein
MQTRTIGVLEVARRAGGAWIHRIAKVAQIAQIAQMAYIAHMAHMARMARMALLALTGLCAIGATGAVCAQPQLPVGDTPLREVANAVERVGRVAGINGPAQLWDAQDRQWTPLQLNRVISQGDRIRSEVQARVEIQVGSLGLWIGPASDVEVLRLDTQAAQLRLNQGHLVARVRTPEWASALQLLTGEAAVQPLAPGLYRLDRDTVSGARSAAASLRGLLSIQVNDSRLQVAAGQRLEVMGAQAGGGLRSTLLLNDAFAAWVQARDQVPEGPVAAATAPWREVTGLDALDAYGRWERHPDEGWIWAPQTVRSGWEPFRDGRWVWSYPWGWTWLDDAPWGFAPSHFGRWIQWNSRWVWVPGAVRNRPMPPVVMPALPPLPSVPPEHRGVRTPRVDGGEINPVRPPPALGWSPGGPPAPHLPGVVDERPPRPERRHGLERPNRESLPPDAAIERRVDRPSDRLVDRPADRPADRPVDRPVDRPSPSPNLRPDRPEPGRNVPRPVDSRPSERPPGDKGDRPERQRQLAQ